MHSIDRSYLATPAGLVATGDVDPETKMRITVVLRPQARMDIMAPRRVPRASRDIPRGYRSNCSVCP
jgi:hypothetical protein